MRDPNDIRYIEDTGWNDYVYRKNKDPNDFSDKAYKRFILRDLVQTEELITSIKKRIALNYNVFVSPDILDVSTNQLVSRIPV